MEVAIDNAVFWLSLQFVAVVDHRHAETNNIYGILDKELNSYLPDNHIHQIIKKNYTIVDSFYTFQNTYVFIAINDDYSQLDSKSIDHLKNVSANKIELVNTKLDSNIYIAHCNSFYEIILNEHCSYQEILKEISLSDNIHIKSMQIDVMNDVSSKQEIMTEYRSNSIINNARITDRYYNKKTDTYYVRVFYK